MSAIPHPARAGIVDAFIPAKLLLPGKRPVYNTYTILGGQDLPVGAVLGRVTASGKLKLVASAAGDGSQNPIAVLQEPIKSVAADGTTAEDKVMAVIVEAFLNKTVLVVGAGFTNGVEDIRDAMAARGLHVRAPGYSG